MNGSLLEIFFFVVVFLTWIKIDKVAGAFHGSGITHFGQLGCLIWWVSCILSRCIYCRLCISRIQWDGEGILIPNIGDEIDFGPDFINRSCGNHVHQFIALIKIIKIGGPLETLRWILVIVILINIE